MKRILFLCSGNYYRSRFAEIFFNWHAERRGLTWRAESRGLAINSFNYGPISPHTVSYLAEHGIPSDEHKRLPRQVDEADLTAADHIVAVKEGEHRRLVEANFPAWRGQVEYWQVHDVDFAVPEEALPHLEREISLLIDRLAA